MTVKIKIPWKFEKEYGYVCELLFNEWSKTAYVVEIHNENIEIEIGSSKIIFPCLLDTNPGTSFKIKIPWSDEEITTFWGTGEIIKEGDTFKFNTDFFAQIFYFLTALENFQNETRDNHDRDDIKHCLLARYNLLEIPVVDQATELILGFIRRNGSAQISEPTFRKILTTDVDHPFDASLISPLLFLKAAKNDIKNKKVDSLYKRFRNLISSRSGDMQWDICNHYEYFGKTAQKFGYEAVAYILNPISPHKKDGPYNIRGKYPEWILNSLIRENVKIGLHGSYATLGNAELLKREKENLECQLKKLTMGYQVTMNRQHYLRWRDASSPKEMEDAGFQFDSTVGSALLPGFRTGTCREYPLWDHRNKQKLKTREIPITFMESALLERKGLNLTKEEAVSKALQLKETVKKYKGTFCVLWHQNRFESEREKNMIEWILK